MITFGQFFKPKAEKYLYQLHEELGLVEEPTFQSYLPFEWYIPFPTPKDPKFKFIDLFAGIGGIRLAYQNHGGKCVFLSEWDSFAENTYEANFEEVPFGDINLGVTLKDQATRTHSFSFLNKEKGYQSIVPIPNALQLAA